MAKRPRCVLGLWTLLAWQETVTQGFSSPLASRVPSRSRQTPGTFGLTHYDNSGASPSTCLMFSVHKGYGPGKERRNDLSNSERLPKDASDVLNSDAVGSAAFSDMSLSQLLEELDRRDIRYEPGATRPELERLLQIPQQGIPQVTPIPSQSSLQAIIKELERRAIRFPPTASRKELEVLLASSLSDGSQPLMEHNTVSNVKKTSTTPTQSLGELSLSELLQELDRQDIRYPPTASRMQLEALLRRAEEANQPIRSSSQESSISLESVPPQRPERRRSGSRKPAERKSRQAARPENIATPSNSAPSRTSGPRMPLSTLLSELDRLNIRYSPTASRAELEELLQQSFEQRALHEERRQRRRREREVSEHNSNSGIKDLLRKSTRVASNSVQKLPRKVSKIATSPHVTSRISGVAESAARQAKRVSRRASDFWNTDEDGIRDIHFEYVSVDRPIDVRAVRVEENDSRRASRPRSVPPRRPPPRTPRSAEPTNRPPPRTRRPGTSSGRATANWQSDGRIPQQRRQRRRPVASSWQQDSRLPKQHRRRRPMSRQSAENSLGSSSFMLPPASQNAVPFPGSRNATTTAEPQRVTVSDSASTRGRQRRTRNGSNDKNKQIYSNYVYDEDGEIEGPFDRLGEFLTNSADRLLWGPESDDNYGSHEQQEQSDGQREQDGRGRKDQTPRYWKDRLAEQVDYALGIHEDGKYYNSWEKQLDEEQRIRDRDGPKFWESNSSPRKRRPPAKGRVKYKRPLWEEDGSIVSMILGRTKRGGKLEVDVSIQRDL
jgi:hypothetical protein